MKAQNMFYTPNKGSCVAAPHTLCSVQKSKLLHSKLDADRQYKTKMHKNFYSWPLAANTLAAIRDASFYCKLVERSIV